MPDDRTIIEALQHVSSATVTTILLKQGLRNVWMRGTRPLRAEQPRIVGRAFTLRWHCHGNQGWRPWRKRSRLAA